MDIALGPFSTTRGGNKIEEFNNILNDNLKIKNFLNSIYRYHKLNIETLGIDLTVPSLDDIKSSNLNARCLMAFEIENKNSRKHIMGSIVNASSLGRIAIGVAYKESVTKVFIRILNYLSFLESVDKTSYNTTNFLIITKEQLLSILNDE